MSTHQNCKLLLRQLLIAMVEMNRSSEENSDSESEHESDSSQSSYVESELG